MQRIRHANIQHDVGSNIYSIFNEIGGENMEEIEKELTEIIKEQLKQCKENKKVPSREVLDTIQVLNTISGL